MVVVSSSSSSSSSSGGGGGGSSSSSSSSSSSITRRADRSLARPTSRCRRTGSIVSLERRVCSFAELQVFSCYRG